MSDISEYGTAERTTGATTAEGSVSLPTTTGSVELLVRGYCYDDERGVVELRARTGDGREVRLSLEPSGAATLASDIADTARFATGDD